MKLPREIIAVHTTTLKKLKQNSFLIKNHCLILEKHASGGFWELSILKEQIPNPRNAMEISVVRTSEYSMS